MDATGDEEARSLTLYKIESLLFFIYTNYITMSTSAAVKPKKSRAISIPLLQVNSFRTTEERIKYVLPKVFGRKSYTLTDETRWISDLLACWDDEEFSLVMKRAYFSRLNDFIRRSSGYTRHLKP